MNSSSLMNENLSALPARLEPCSVLRPLGYYLIFLWIIGTFLNGSVLYIFIRHKKLRQTSTNLLIGGLLLADFLGACFEIPLPAVALLSCRWIFGRFGCVFEAMIAYFAGCSNMYMLCFISIDRYIVVTKSFSTTTVSLKQTYAAIASAYGLALFWTILPVVGWSSFDFEGTGASCAIKWEDRSFNVVSYNLTILVFVYVIPVTIILITNIRVLIMIHERRRNANVNLNETHTRRQFTIERRVAHTVILIVGGFLVAWTPYAIAVLIRICVTTNVFPPIAGTVPAMFAKTSVVWNPFIYVVRNRNFRYYLPFCPGAHEQRRKISDPTHLSVYPYSGVHLPLTVRPSCRET